MGKNNKRLIYLDFVYMGIIFIPFIFFARDFFHFIDFIQVLNKKTFDILFFTIKQAFISATLALILGIIPGVYLSKSKGFMAKLINSSIFIPFFFPVISTVISFTIIFNWKIFKDLDILYTFNGIIIANIFYNLPLFVKYIGEGLNNIEKSLKEAFILETNSKFRIFFNLYLPLIKDSVLKGYFLAFSYCFSSFAIILSIGGIKFTTLEVAIATTLKGSYDFSKAFSYGLLQFIILFLINYFINRKNESIELNKEEKNEKSNSFEKLYIIIYLIFEYGLVLISLVYAFYNYLENKFTFIYFKSLFSREFNKKFPVLLAIRNSTLIALVTAFITLILTYIFLKNKHKFTSTIILSSLGISSAFLGIGLIYLNILFNINYLILLIVGYLVITIPIAYSFMHYHINSFNKSLLEASYIDGSTPLKTFIYIEFPILKGVFLSTFLQVFAVIFTEFTISYTMQISDYLPTISIINYSMANSKYILESSALSGLNTIIIIILFLFSNSIYKKLKI